MAARCGVGLRTERLEPDSCSARETSGSTQTDYPRGVALIDRTSDSHRRRAAEGWLKQKCTSQGRVKAKFDKMFNETPRGRFRGFRLTRPPEDRLGFNDTLRLKPVSPQRKPSKMEKRSCVHGAKILIDKFGKS